MSLNALSSEARRELQDTVENVMVAAFKLLAPEERYCKGVYFHSADEHGRTLVLFPLGVIPDDEVHTYITLVGEEVCRLSRHPEHEASSQNCTVDDGVPGGSIRVLDDSLQYGEFFALAGLPCRPFAEAVCLVVAMKLGVHTFKTAQAIADETSNNYFAPLRGLCNVQR